MRIRHALLTIGKVLASAVIYYVGFLLGSIFAGAMGMEVPALPAGTDAQTLGLVQLAVSLIFAAVLALLARHLGGNFLLRWLSLALFSWVLYGLNTYLEAAIFTAYAAASAYTLVMQGAASLLCSAAVAWWFAPKMEGRLARVGLGTFFRSHSAGQWAWRFLVAWIAFPIIYLIFGWLVQPFIIEFYRQEMAGLVLPGWGQILPTQALRSLLFLLACLPIVLLWRGSRRKLFILLGSALFLLVGGLYMLQAYWYPLSLRLAHSLEILADSLVYAAVLTVLLARPTHRRAIEGQR